MVLVIGENTFCLTIGYTICHVQVSEDGERIEALIPCSNSGHAGLSSNYLDIVAIPSVIRDISRQPHDLQQEFVERKLVSQGIEILD